MQTGPTDPSLLIAFGAASEALLRQRAASLAERLSGLAGRSLRCFALEQSEASPGAARAACLFASAEEGVRGLQAIAAGQAAARAFWGCPSTPPQVAFAFTGQGSQYSGMGRELHATSRVFRDALERLTSAFVADAGPALRDVLFEQEHAQRLRDTRYTQPALFCLESALVTLWAELGLRPDAVLGHSVGEYVAAWVAGSVSEDAALQLIAERARQLAALPGGGGMLALRCEASVALELARDCDLDLAAINGPRAVVLSGPSSALQVAQAAAKERGITSIPLSVSHAFHSALVEPMLADFERYCGRFTYSPPQLSWVSNLTGDLLVAEPGPGYWARHVRGTVRFEACVRSLRERGTDIFLEVGPGTTLTAMGEQIAPDAHWVPSLRRGGSEAAAVVEAGARLFARGCALDPRRLAALAAGEPEGVPEVRGAAPGAAAPGALEPIAVVGMACHLPEAPDLDALLGNLRAGRNSVGCLSKRWPLAPSHAGSAPAEARWAALLEDVQQFDPELFGFEHEAARTLHPQQRLLLQVAFRALEDAGHTGAGPHQTGVFVGGRMTHLAGSSEDALPAAAAGVHAQRIALLGRSQNFLAAWLSDRLDLRGPSFVVDSACSSSLLAFHLACQSLRAGECESAVAAGVDLVLDRELSTLLARVRALSPRGQCRTFDASADGYVMGEGCGAVVLKPLAAALRDRDRIVCLVLGSHVNNDGSTMGITTPSLGAQAALLQRLYGSGAGQIDPRTISYLEAHGTGTMIGDPIEVKAIGKALVDSCPDRAPCYLGSLKSNIGHLHSAAGIASVLKVALQLRHRQLFPTLHCEQPNPRLEFGATPLIPNRQLRDWALEAGHGSRRRAGISSFALGGTNVHVVLEEAPEEARMSAPPRLESGAVPRPELLVLSGHTPAALQQLANRYASFLPGVTVPLAQLAQASQLGRRHQRLRLGLVGRTPGDWLKGIEAPRAPAVPSVFSWSCPEALLSAPDAARHASELADIPAFAASWQETAAMLDGPEPAAWPAFRLALALARALGRAVGSFLGRTPWEGTLRDHLQGGLALSEVRARLRQLESTAVEGLAAPLPAPDAWTLVLGPSCAAGAPGARVSYCCAAQGDSRQAFLEVVARLYEAGADFAWNALWPAPLPKPELPPTPLQTVDCSPQRVPHSRATGTGEVVESPPVDVLVAAATSAPAAATMAPHPWLQRVWTQSSGELRFEGSISESDALYRDHRVWGTPMLPGVSWLEILHAAAVRGGRPVSVLRDVEWITPLTAVRGHVSIEGSIAPGGQFEIRSSQPHVRGRIVWGPDSASPGAPPPALTAASVAVRGDGSGPRAYERLRQLGYDHVGVYLNLSRLTSEQLGQDGWTRHSSAELQRSPRPEAFAALDYDPGMLDSATLAALSDAVVQKLAARAEPFIPLLVEEVRLLRPVPAAARVDVEHHSWSSEVGRVSIDVRDPAGQCCIRFTNLAFKRAPRESLAAPGGRAAAPPWLWAELWSPLGAAPAPRASELGTLVFVAPRDARGMACVAALRARGASVVHAAPRAPEGQACANTELDGDGELDPSRPELWERLWDRARADRPAELIFAPAASAEASSALDQFCAFGRAFARGRERGRTGRAWLLTSGAVAAGGEAAPRSAPHAALWGAARCLALELPGASVRSIDADPQASPGQVAELLLGELVASGPRQVAQRSGQRWGRRLERVEPGETDVPLVRAGLCVLTGAAGGIAQALAPWLHREFGSRLALLGRCPAADPRARQTLERLRAQGADVAWYSADVSDEGSLAAALAAIRAERGPIESVFHLAGATRDELLREHAKVRSEVWAAKARGTELLDRLTQADPLRCFVVFSSLTGWLGNVGQAGYAAANCFADAHVQARRGRGRSSSIAWGPWLETGMTRAPAARAQLQQLGLRPLPVEAALEALRQALRGDWRSVAIVDHDAERLALASPDALLQPLPAPSRAAAAHLAPAPAPAAPERALRWLATQLGVAPALLREDSQFLSLGLDSAALVDASRRLGEALGVDLYPTSLFEYPSARLLLEYLGQEHAAALARAREAEAEESGAQPVANAPQPPVDAALTPPLVIEPVAAHAEAPRLPGASSASEAIAIIGKAGRYGSAQDLHAYWELLCSGQSAVRPLRSGERPGFTADVAPPAAWLPALYDFDPALFGIDPAEARELDPQQRLILESTVQAFQSAGLGRSPWRGRAVGVFIGCGHDHYGTYRAARGSRYSGISLETTIANRLSFALGWTGPSLAVNTLCSASLVALHWACAALRSGQCDAAVAGGVHAGLSQQYFETMRGLGALSASACRPFDDRADGYLPGEGAGVVLLKRWSDAQRDGDPIYGLIRGSAVNQGGSSGRFDAPDLAAEKALLQRALQAAGLAAGALDYIDAHAVGTAIGDAIEARAIASVHTHDDRPALLVGSSKALVGHLESAAGIASLHKLLLAFAHEQLPGTPGVQQLNRHLERFSGVRIATEHTRWPQQAGPSSARPRRAGVNAFGLYGANAHLIVEEPPSPAREPARALGTWLLPISERNPARLAERTRELAAWLPTAPALGDALFSLAHLAGDFPARSVALVDGGAGLCELADAPEAAPRELVTGISLWLGDGPTDALQASLQQLFPLTSARLARQRAQRGPASADLLVLLACALRRAGMPVKRCGTLGSGPHACGVAELADRLREHDELATKPGERVVGLALACEPAARLDMRAGEWPWILGGGVAPPGACALDGSLESLLATIGRAWQRGASLDWPELYGELGLRRRAVPAVRFDRQHYSLFESGAGAAPPSVEAPPPQALSTPPVARRAQLEQRILTQLARVTGCPVPGATTPFLALGLDSMRLLQLAAALGPDLGMELSAIDLFQAPSPAQLAEWLDERLPMAQELPSVQSGAGTSQPRLGSGAPPASLAGKARAPSAAGLAQLLQDALALERRSSALEALLRERRERSERSTASPAGPARNPRFEETTT